MSKKDQTVIIYTPTASSAEKLIKAIRDSGHAVEMTAAHLELVVSYVREECAQIAEATCYTASKNACDPVLSKGQRKAWRHVAASCSEIAARIREQGCR